MPPLHVQLLKLSTQIGSVKLEMKSYHYLHKEESDVNSGSNQKHNSVAASRLPLMVLIHVLLSDLTKQISRQFPALQHLARDQETYFTSTLQRLDTRSLSTASSSFSPSTSSLPVGTVRTRHTMAPTPPAGCSDSDGLCCTGRGTVLVIVGAGKMRGIISKFQEEITGKERRRLSTGMY
jgi:hypothetical protein